jgi:Ca2+-binding RTX toxin-like protein
VAALRRVVLPVLVLVASLLIVPSAGATLKLLQPDAAVPATFTGHAGYSADGLGQQSPGGSVQAEVPAGSTVEHAYLYGSYTSFNDTVAERTIDFDGTNVELTYLTNSEPNCCGFATARGDVTSMVKAKVGAGGGITDFVIGNDPGSLEGVALVVIYSNPALPVRSIAVLDGGSKSGGDSATVSLEDPIDKTDPDFGAILSLGSGFSYQNGSAASHNCGGVAQFSTVDINGQRLTSCAGNYDDGEANNGALLTVGGVGDTTDNPADPNSQTGTDDELYSLAPLLDNGDQQIVIETANPSTDDNLFLAVFQVPGRASVKLEGPPGSATCTDSTDNDGDGKTDAADPDCQTVEGPAGNASCSDFVDNDGDGKTDQADPDCQSAEGPVGDASCSDGVDNDGDGKTDAADTGCQSGPPPTGEDLCFGEPATITGNGTVNGTNGDDVIITGNGADTVDGKGGNDRICSRGGDDHVRGGAGNDRINSGNGNDDTGGQAGEDLIQSTGGNDDVQGGDGMDRVQGGEGNDTLNGGNGSDSVEGQGGNDLLAGNADAPDYCDGGSGTDKVAANGGCEVIANVP